MDDREDEALGALKSEESTCILNREECSARVCTLGELRWSTDPKRILRLCAARRSISRALATLIRAGSLEAAPFEAGVTARAVNIAEATPRREARLVIDWEPFRSEASATFAVVNREETLEEIIAERVSSKERVDERARLGRGIGGEELEVAQVRPSLNLTLTLALALPYPYPYP